MPTVKMYADVRDVTASRIRDDIGYLPQVIVGSPPCQDASLANTSGEGVSGERTGLFFEAIRLVDEIRPVWACFENVPGIRTRGADRILFALESLGYACWPVVVGAWHAGAPHRRNRVWIIAAAPDAASHGRGTWRPRRLDPGDTGQQQQALQIEVFADADKESLREQLWRRGGTDWTGAPITTLSVGNTDKAEYPFRKGKRSDACAELPAALRAIGQAWRAWCEPIARHLGMDDGISARLALQCVSAYGDAVVPQITEAIGRCMMRLSPTDGTVLDLFCGAAGGWSLGMHRSGYKTVAACEIDDWRREVFQARWN